MRVWKLIATASIAAAVLPNTYAAEKSTNPCTLLKWEDLQPFGAAKDTALTDAGWHEEAPPKGMPGSRLFTNMCAIAIKSDAGRSSITLSFDSFSGKASEQQVKDWLKASSPATPEDGTKIVKLGETTCESGRYDLPTSQDDGSVANKVERYIACDQLVGMHHVSLNVHVPESSKSLLPSPEQAKALLEKSIVRMHQQSFSIAGRTD